MTDKPKYPFYAENFEGKNTYEIEDNLYIILEKINEDIELDPSWKAMAKSYFEQGFMALRRGFIKNQGINPMNKFSLKDVDWKINYEHQQIIVNHKPTNIQCREYHGICILRDLWDALQTLEFLVNSHYQKIEDNQFSEKTIEIAEKISTGAFSHIESPLVFRIVEAVMRELGKSNNDEINVNKNKIDNQMDIRLLQNDKMLSYDEQAGARLKVLDLAIASFEGVLERPGNDKLIDTAQRFYNYITKGE